MRGMTVSAVVCCLVLALFVGCKTNQPPAKPVLSGPTQGVPGKSLAYTISTTDPEGDDVAYLVSWGDGRSEDWDEGYLSGDEVRRVHKFVDSGVYIVKVKARDDKEVESEWSNSITVSIAFWPPNQPQPPTGPATCTTGVAARFAAKTTHPMGDSVRFQFDWGDTMGDWGGLVASDSVYSEEHIFDTAGTYNVLVRAKDARTSTSAWSDPFAVTIIFVAAPARPVVAWMPLEKGAKLRLTWGKVADAGFYEIKTDDSVHTTTDTSFDVASPAATIEVRAVKGSRKSDAAVVPVGMVETPNIAIYGMSDSVSSHYPTFGFDTTGTAVAYSLASSNYLKMDYYADDVTNSPKMFLVNPGKNGWNTKRNGLVDAGTTVYVDAKLADTIGYVIEREIEAGNVYYLWLDRGDVGWSADDSYAKAKVLQISGTQIMLQIGYQRVGGLRWLSK